MRRRFRRKRGPQIGDAGHIPLTGQSHSKLAHFAAINSLKNRQRGRLNCL